MCMSTKHHWLKIDPYHLKAQAFMFSPFFMNVCKNAKGQKKAKII